MKLTYIFNSGFVIEQERSVLVFDYWKDPAHVMNIYMNTSKHVYVFSSHFHEDHFTSKIFKWKEDIRNVTYILSKDILRRRRAKKDDADIWMAKGAVWEDGNIKVTATGSNDSGVSWIVNAEGRSIFHAGDLNNWYARFLADRENLTDTVISEEFGKINPLRNEKIFLGELKDIHKVTDTFDLVMFPVDGRIGNGYTLGGRQFIERFHVGIFVPMHFVMSGFESAWRMDEFCKERDIPFWYINKDGDSINI